MRIKHKLYHIFCHFILVIVGLFAFQVTANATSNITPLPADQAFVFSTSLIKPNEIRLEWRIAPQYYLYTKQMQVSFTPDIKADIQLPQGELQYDTQRGRFEAYSGYISIPIVVIGADLKQSFQMKVQYQGCSHEGFCYPPMQRLLQVDLNAGTIQSIEQTIKLSTDQSFSTLLTDQNKIKQLLDTSHIGIVLLIFLGLGLLLAFTPCVLPMIPILTSIIVGQHRLNLRQSFLLSLTYVLGSAFAYALAGWTAAAFGGLIQVWLQQIWVTLLMSGFFVLLALSLFGVYDVRLPHPIQSKLTKWTHRPHHQSSYTSVFSLGLLSTLIVSPCVTAPLVGVLMYIAQTGDKWLGSTALFAMGLGMGIPLLLIGTSAGRWLPKTGQWMIIVKQVFGLLMLAMAVWLISRVLNQTITTLLWSGFLLVVALFFVKILPKFTTKSISLTLGITCTFFSLLTILSTMHGGALLYPLQANADTAAKNTFIMVKNIPEIERQLVLSRMKHQPVILDFYADWCESCVAMDTQVFSSNSVKKVLSDYKLLRVDLTVNNSQTQALMTHFQVIAPPTVLVFDGWGKEVAVKRMVGELSAKEFLQRLTGIDEQVAFNK